MVLVTTFTCLVLFKIIREIQLHNQQEIDDLKNIVQESLEEAKRFGASSAEAGLNVEKGLSVTARLGEVETIEHHRDQGLGITVYFGQRKGSASTTDLLPDSIKETVRATCSIARFTSEDEFAGLPDAEHLATQFPDLDLYHPWTLTSDATIDLVLECEQAARSYDALISNSEGASVNSHQGIGILGNTLGFLNHVQTTRHSLSCSVLGEKAGSMQRDYWYSVARRAEDLEAATSIGEKAAQRTIQRLGAQTLSTRQCPVIFAAEIASGLLSHLIGAISGGKLYRNATFLLDKKGIRIFPEFIHIHEQPNLSRALGSNNYDAEGVATQTRDIIADGVLQDYVLSSYSARKLGLQTTGNAGGVHNLTIAPGDKDLDGLLRQMDTGLLVTEVLGQGVNFMTGDYSRGAAGFWVEKGQIQYPVEEITIAGNLVDMFQQIVAVGNDIELRGSTRTGSIMLEQMTIAGN